MEPRIPPGMHRFIPTLAPGFPAVPAAPRKASDESAGAASSDHGFGSASDDGFDGAEDEEFDEWPDQQEVPRPREGRGQSSKWTYSLIEESARARDGAQCVPAPGGGATIDFKRLLSMARHLRHRPNNGLNWEEAEAHFRHILENRSAVSEEQFKDAYLGLAKIATRKGDLHTAIGLCNEALSHDKVQKFESLRIVEFLAGTLLRVGAYEEAAHFVDVLGRFSSVTELHLTLEQHKFAEATYAKALQMLAAHTERSDKQVALNEQAYQIGQRTDSFGVQAKYHVWKARALGANRVDHFTQAKGFYEKLDAQTHYLSESDILNYAQVCLELGKQNIDSKNNALKAQELLERKRYLLNGRFKKVASEVHNLLESVPAMTKINEGNALRASGNMRAALTCYNEAMVLHPSDEVKEAARREIQQIVESANARRQQARTTQAQSASLPR